MSRSKQANKQTARKNMTSEELKDKVIAQIEETKAENLVILDVRGKTSITDYIVIASGASSRQVKSIANIVADGLKEDNVKVLGKEGEDVGEWVLLDLGDLVLHIMQPSIREYYDLEKLWSV